VIDETLADAERQVSDLRSEVIREFTDECAEITDERLALDREIEAALDEVRERFREREEALEEKMQGYIDAVTEALQERLPDISEFDWPEHKDADEIEDPLFDSKRDYMTQNQCYRDRRVRAGNKRKGKRANAENTLTTSTSP
jgi:hypothetical protein